MPALPTFRKVTPAPAPNHITGRDAPSSRSTSEHEARIQMDIIALDSNSRHAANMLDLKSSKLSRAILILLSFFSFGVGFYHYYEDMTIPDSLYFTILTISTVGYGDLVPTSKTGKLVTCAFVFAGLALLAEAIGIFADYFLERVNEVARQVAEESALREKEMALAKIEVEKVATAEENLHTVMSHDGLGGKGDQSVEGRRTSAATRHSSVDASSTTSSLSSVKSSVKTGSAMSTLISGMVAINKVRSATATKGRRVANAAQVNASIAGATPANALKIMTAEELLAEDKEQAKQENMQALVKLSRSLFYIVLSIFAGTLFYAVVEGEGSCVGISLANNQTCVEKDIVDAFYMSCITVTSVGYGDIKPHTSTGKMFGVFWIITGTALVGRAIGNYLEFQSNKKQGEIRQRILAKPLTLAEIEMADIDDSKSLSEAEFVLYKLQAMGILKVADVDKVTRKFRMELSSGADEEVHIPPADYITDCFQKGEDFNEAIIGYQKEKKKEERVEKRKLAEDKAKSIIDRHKKGAFAGAVFKLRELVENSGNAELKEQIRSDDLLSNLPDAENFDEEVKHEIKKIEYREAEARIKEMRNANGGEGAKKREEGRKASVAGVVSTFSKKLQRRASDAKSSRERPAGKEEESEADARVRDTRGRAESAEVDRVMMRAMSPDTAAIEAGTGANVIVETNLDVEEPRVKLKAEP